MVQISSCKHHSAGHTLNASCLLPQQLHTTFVRPGKGGMHHIVRRPVDCHLLTHLLSLGFAVSSRFSLTTHHFTADVNSISTDLKDTIA
ncbi:unnamed protein product [Protopolystoma xenopodis]|uniref:Uncharacterized protein n=1 Tax=Protopolystoma xenopodis TaxID=117903 RepID=A0A448X589_9PLAT|nr:unnamed protein product [Protopolystoma xenopodis]